MPVATRTTKKINYLVSSSTISARSEKVFSMKTIPSSVKDLAWEVRKAGGRLFLVGGAVRDKVLGKQPKDYDCEVYGLRIDDLERIAQKLGEVNAVGKHFGILKLRVGNDDFDISIPRRDSKNGKGHKGFLVQGDPYMTIKEAAQRRDLTINSMSLDPLTGEFFDPFSGLKDLKNRVIRATDPEKFKEDPLRVLRVMQFASRFQASVEPKTIEVCRSLLGELKELPSSRITEEWKKLLIKGEKPSIGLKVGQEIGVFKVLHPEIEKLVGVPQDNKWHPEGDVFEHTAQALDQAALIAKKKKLTSLKKLILMLSVLTHDLGKAVTTKEVNGRIHSYNHEIEGEKIAKKFLQELDFGEEVNAKVLKLVRYHTSPATLWEAESKGEKVSPAAIKRLAARLKPATLGELFYVYQADQQGRDLQPEKKKDIEKSLQWLWGKAEQLQVRNSAPKPLLRGKHLIKYLHWQPGPNFGKILREVRQAQLDGEVRTKFQALKRAKTIMWTITYQNSWIEAEKKLSKPTGENRN